MPQVPDLNSLAVEVTNRCNMRCKMCVSHGASHYRGQADGHPPFLSEELFRSLIDQYAALKQSGPKCVLPQFQGEPLLHPKFLEYCEYLERKGLDFGFTTNASRLTPEKARALAKMRRFRSIAFSIDGHTKATYEGIRLAARYEQVIANVEAFLALPEARELVTSISFTVQPENEAEVEPFLREWVPRVNFVSLNDVAVNGRPTRWSGRRRGSPAATCGVSWWS